MSNIYNAIMRAADHIESNPHLYDFIQIKTPPEDGDCKACMLGWIGYFMGMYSNGIEEVSAAIRCQSTIYLPWEHVEPPGSLGSVEFAVRVMRDFANTHHKNSTEQAPPDWNEWIKSLGEHENVVPIRSAA